LLKDGQPADLTPKTALLLLALLEGKGDVVTRDELIQRLWGDTSVGDGSLTFQVHLLRKALGDDGDVDRYVLTVPKHGYRLVGAVRTAAAADEAMAAAVVPAMPPSEVLSPAVPGVSQSAPIPQEPVRVVRRARWTLKAALAVTAALTLVLVAAASGRLWTERPDPRVVRYTQLSHDGRLKSLAERLLQSGSRLYFREGMSRALASVPVEGGETSRTEAGSPMPDVVDISVARSEYLAIRDVDREAVGELWVVPMVSGPSRRVGDVRCRKAAWAPDGSRIACTTNTSAFVVNADGSGMRPLDLPAGHPDWPRWSPDGRVLRFTVSMMVDRSPTATIWEISPNGGGLRQLLPAWPRSSLVCCGDWSPDGQNFVFEARRDHTSDLWLLREGRNHVASQEPVQLTDGPLRLHAPTWSADGSRIYAFGMPVRGELVRYDSGLEQFVPYMGGLSAIWVSYAKARDVVAYAAFPENTLWLARPDGSERRQLTFPPFEVDGVTLSPDGRWVAFRARTPGREYKVHLLSTDGGTPQPLTSEDVAQGVPSWSPDSQRLTFGDVPPSFGQPRGGEVIHVYDIADRAWSTLPGSEGLWTSRWSPDGRFIAALTIRGQRLRLFDVETGRWRQLPADHLNNASWSRDGRYIYYDTEGGAWALRRVRVSDGHVEDIVSLDTFATPAYWWSGVSPDGSPLMLRSLGALELYALEVKDR
jgi:Tol biopolymer transport system component/DNA-binding winged helix-turn-helix (wHTH) protein